MQKFAPKYGLIGHRGVAGLRPENTYCSFSLAAELGLNWIEFDVQLTKDNHWVVMHDDTLERTSNGHGKIGNYTLQQLETLQAGLWFEPPYQNQPIPTLVKTIELAEKLGLHCNIEIKGADQDPEKHAKLMFDFAQEYLGPLQSKHLISSFNLPCIVALRKHAPKIPIGYLIDRFTPDTMAITLDNNFDSINCDADNIIAEDVLTATNNNIPLCLFTINDKNLAKFWFERGIAAVFTDRADLLL